jgi:transitional endoplasmic reticulum ATPase
MRFNKNDNIGAYTVKFQHKQAAYAETYRVRDSQGKLRFLKLIDYSKLSPSQLDDNGQIIEIEISKKLFHPNLCAYIDSGNLIISGRQYAYLVTEFISGETLDTKIERDGSLNVYEIKTVAKAILSALTFIHNCSIPIIHNEITLQNVMLDLVGGLRNLKLIDFGHTRYLNQTPVKPNFKEMNVFYMAPERLSGVCSVQTDLFSVGVIMYKLLYDRLPWFIDLSGLKEDDILEAVLAEREKELELPDICKFELDEQLQNIIAKSLSYDADDRFQTAEDFIKAIDGEVLIERQSTKRKILLNAIPKGNNTLKPIKKKGKGFAAIAGMEDLKTQMREEIIEPLHHPEEYQQYGITFPNGMLLYGPPGCGKTFFAKHFAEEVGFNFICLTPAMLKSKWVNASQENIAKLFKEAEEHAPTIIFIDEINELVPNRESDVHEMTKSAVNEMLAQMDRTGEKGVFVIGATNLPQDIDPAILRAGRLEKKYYVGVPDHEARKALFKLYLKNRPYDFGLDYDELADITQNYVSADIQMIINDASRNALKCHSKITMGLLRMSVRATSPSLSEQELIKYRQMKEFIEGNRCSNKRPHIGFN